MLLALSLVIAASPETVHTRWPEPAGFTRVVVSAGSFGEYLRQLEVLPRGTPVRTYDGREILAADDARLAGVLDLDVGTRDLQQCADTAMRLHAEWLFARGRALEVTHHLTNGDAAPFSRWARGERPTLVDGHFRWANTARPLADHATFRRYLDFVFVYAGTASLAREGRKVSGAELQPGDVFVMPRPSSFGHAVIVLDLAVDATGHRVALLAQGFMPAQSAHVLRGPLEGWFSLDGDSVETPFWEPFGFSTLRRMTP